MLTTGYQEQVASDGSKRQRKPRANAEKGSDDEDGGDAFLPPKITRRILEQAREQRDEMEEEQANRSKKARHGEGALGAEKVRWIRSFCVLLLPLLDKATFCYFW